MNTQQHTEQQGPIWREDDGIHADVIVAGPLMLVVVGVIFFYVIATYDFVGYLLGALLIVGLIFAMMGAFVPVP